MVRSGRAFSLVELMMALAVTSVLAALAVPMVHDAQLRARAVEPVVNLQGLMDHAVTHYAEVGWLPQGHWEPRDLGDLDRQAWPWRDRGGAFEEVGWEPDGEVRCLYLLEGFAPVDAKVHAYAVCDLDGDGLQGRIWWSRQGLEEPRETTSTCMGGEGFRGVDCPTGDTSCTCW